MRVTLREYRESLLQRIAAVAVEASRNEDHALFEGIGELESIFDFLDGKNPHFATLTDICDWFGEPCPDIID